MSRRTIRACDLLCDVLNWNSSIHSVTVSLVAAVQNGDTIGAKHLADEIHQWTKRRDQKQEALQRVVASFTREDIAHIRRRAPRLEGQIYAVGGFCRPRVVHQPQPSQY
jgi:hypothetical protein